jgi:GrpB-like predicted nucleotidyltransferase (UPF0157 family)
MNDAPIIIVPYNPEWPRVFASERGRLETVFPPECVRIEHIGSTAVPDLAAKPIVDVILGAPSLAFVDERAPRVLELGYEFPAEPNSLVPERRYFRRFVGGARKFHLHCVVEGGDFWRRHLLFRDYLRKYPQEARDYHRLKAMLADRYRHGLREYTDAKSEFIQDALKKAAKAPDLVHDA